MTPLSFAAFRGHEGVVKVLLGCDDVNPNSRYFNGRTPLSYATRMRREGVVKLLSDARNSNSKPLEIQSIVLVRSSTGYYLCFWR